MTSEQNPDSDAAASTPATPPLPAWSPRRWARTINDRVPTKWIAAIGTGLFLAATAAFGGLAEVAAAPTPELRQGEMFVGAELEMTVIGVELADERHGSGVFPADDSDERVLSVIFDVTSFDQEARPTFQLGSLRSVALVDAITLDTTEPSITRVDDGTINPYLQPGVPVRLMLSWLVSDDALADGDKLRLTLPQATEVLGTMVTSGEYWTDIATGAFVTTTVEDIGLGTASPEGTL